MQGKLYSQKGAWLRMEDEADRIYFALMVNAYIIRPYNEIAT